MSLNSMLRICTQLAGASCSKQLIVGIILSLCPTEISGILEFLTVDGWMDGRSSEGYLLNLI